MGSRPSLTEREKNAILSLSKQKLPVYRISAKIKRSRHCITNFLKDPKNYGYVVKNRKKRKVTNRVKRTILKSASNKRISAAKIINENNLNLLPSTVYRVIHDSPHIILQKKKKSSFISKANIT